MSLSSLFFAKVIHLAEFGFESFDLRWLKSPNIYREAIMLSDSKFTISIHKKKFIIWISLETIKDESARE